MVFLLTLSFRYQDWKIPQTRKNVVFQGRLKLIMFDDNGVPQDPLELDQVALGDHFRNRVSIIRDV